MSNSATPAVGIIGWRDLTVQNAEGVRDFYSEVAGWTATPLSMGGYSDCAVCALYQPAPPAA